MNQTRFDEMVMNIDLSPIVLTKGKLIGYWQRIVVGSSHESVAPIIQRVMDHCCYRMAEHGINAHDFAVRKLLQKGKEYSAKDDRLFQFKPCYGDATESTASLIGMARKHYRYVMDMEHGLKPTDKESVEEKYGDLLNYCILLLALLEDRYVENTVTLL